jgi:hypothetical protein
MLNKALYVLVIVLFAISCGTFTSTNSDEFAGSLSVQSTNNDAQRIVGTWVASYGDYGGVYNMTYAFNSNGTFIILNSADNSQLEDGRYFVSNSKLILASGNLDFALVIDYYLSVDGKILCFKFYDDYRWFFKQ